MVTSFRCPHLFGEIELTAERERHIAETHPDLLPKHHACIKEVLDDPDQVRISARLKNARLFSRWFQDVRDGKHIVVVVVSETGPVSRHWIITAYLARKIAGGEIEWERS